MKILVIVVVLCIGCSSSKQYRATYKKPSYREIKKAMEYSSSEYNYRQIKTY